MTTKAPKRAKPLDDNDLEKRGGLPPEPFEGGAPAAPAASVATYGPKAAQARADEELAVALERARALAKALPELATRDAGAPFTDEALAAIRLLREHDPAEHARLRDGLKAASVSMRDLSRSLRLLDSTASSDRAAKDATATRLVGLADDAELFHDPDDGTYATIPVDAHRETYPLRSRGFKTWLAKRYFDVERKAASGHALADALGVLEGKALFEGATHSVFVRVAEFDGAVYLDLGNQAHEVVRATAAAWEILSESPVKFRRPSGMLSLPRPVRGGSVTELRPFLNLAPDEAEASFVNVVAWLVGSLRPTGPKAVLSVSGEQGSGKSTFSRVVRSTIDPATAALRTIPKEERDLAIMARNGYVVAFDNLSGLQPWVSDALCRLATGGGLSTRQLFSDMDEVIFDARRPIILNGIEGAAERPDLLDRSILVSLRSIEETAARRDEEEFWRDFESVHPRVLGALLDGVVMGLRNLRTVSFRRLPRMADFARFVMASEAAFGWAPGTFIAAYDRNRDEAVEQGLEIDPVATALRAFVEKHGEWTGTAAELLEALVPDQTDMTKRAKEWPKSSRALSDRLKRLAPPLRAVGIYVTRPARKKGARLWTVAGRRGGATVTTVTTVTSDGEAAERQGVAAGDGPRTEGDGRAPRAGGTVTGEQGPGDGSPQLSLDRHHDRHLASLGRARPGDGGDGGDGCAPSTSARTTLFGGGHTFDPDEEGDH